MNFYPASSRITGAALKKLLLLVVVFPVLSRSYGIIYRHDVPEERYRALAMQPQFNCVGEVFDMSAGLAPIGSCVLIGERYILSAAHVFVKSDFRQDTIMHGDQKIIANQPYNTRMGDAGDYQFRFQRRMYAARSMKVLPQYLEAGDYDLVLIELAEPVKGITPARLNKTLNEAGNTFTAVGFGVSGNAADPEDVGPYFTKLAGQNVIDTIKGTHYNGQPTLLAFDFDHPADVVANLMGSARPLPMEFICGGGDSGGGMFRETSSGWELIGICSGSRTDFDILLKSGYYGQEATYTRVAAFQQWITDAIKQFDSERK